MGCEWVYVGEVFLFLVSFLGCHSAMLLCYVLDISPFFCSRCIWLGIIICRVGICIHQLTCTYIQSWIRNLGVRACLTFCCSHIQRFLCSYVDRACYLRLELYIHVPVCLYQVDRPLLRRYSVYWHTRNHIIRTTGRFNRLDERSIIDAKMPHL